mgnify:CR=1 FL=1
MNVRTNSQKKGQTRNYRTDRRLKGRCDIRTENSKLTNRQIKRWIYGEKQTKGWEKGRLKGRTDDLKGWIYQ